MAYKEGEKKRKNLHKVCELLAPHFFFPLPCIRSIFYSFCFPSQEPKPALAVCAELDGWPAWGRFNTEGNVALSGAGCPGDKRGRYDLCTLAAGFRTALPSPSGPSPGAVESNYLSRDSPLMLAMLPVTERPPLAGTRLLVGVRGGVRVFESRLC